MNNGTVLFTDESKFKIFGGRRRQYVRRLVGERMNDQNIILTVKHGGRFVLVWGCFPGGKAGDLMKIESIMDKIMYHNILQRHVFPC